MNKRMLTKLSALGMLTASPCYAATVNYNFDDGTLQGWTNNVPSGTTGEDYISSNSVTRSPGQSGSYSVLESDFSDRDGTDTTVKVISSELFTMNNSSTISLYLNGGMGSTATPTWSNYSNLPSSATDSGYLGVALRRVSDGEYLLFDRKATNGQYSGGWQQVGWNTTEISNAISGDAANETYQIDLIDTFSDGWGWVSMDTVTMENVTVVPEPSSAVLIGLGGLSLMMRRRK
ncbi:PEP-CTERM sorting domain-containing protein [Verrucomicrobiaceae bacterium N1E253]|uniref:PEP-CTERM sorting domain-containing protein n=1 Tax=Oceaniferula marina TaxID=2748318 RepID=A0A851GGW1_9BACT|nr:PEP-CTERM sorting domain-containing protein [Oceaniferula marina]NWK55081.1 PEP-CTERM sorting domain-containing protein [Oceaniferula marina]